MPAPFAHPPQAVPDYPYLPHARPSPRDGPANGGPACSLIPLTEKQRLLSLLFALRGTEAAAPPLPSPPAGFTSAEDPRIASGRLFPTHWAASGNPGDSAGACGGSASGAAPGPPGGYSWVDPALAAMLSAQPGPRSEAAAAAAQPAAERRGRESAGGGGGRGAGASDAAAAGGGGAGAAAALHGPDIAAMVRDDHLCSRCPPAMLFDDVLMSFFDSLEISSLPDSFLFPCAANDARKRTVPRFRRPTPFCTLLFRWCSCSIRSASRAAAAAAGAPAAL